MLFGNTKELLVVEILKTVFIVLLMKERIKTKLGLLNHMILPNSVRSQVYKEHMYG